MAKAMQWPESLRQLVFGLAVGWFAWPSAGIGNEFTIGVVDRNGDVTAKKSAGTVA